MRVLIGEDEALLREGLRLMLTRDGIDVVDAVGDARTLVERAGAVEPDVVVTDIRMPPGNADDGLRAAIRLRRREVPVLVLSQHVQRRYALELLGERPSGVGYLLKQRIADPGTFCRDVRRVAGGDTVLDAEVVTAMVARVQRHSDALQRLTPRQGEVLAQVAQGRSNAAIARELTITEKAVVHHVSRIYEALGIPDSTDDHRRVLAVVSYLAG